MLSHFFLLNSCIDNRNLLEFQLLSVQREKVGRTATQSPTGHPHRPVGSIEYLAIILKVIHGKEMQNAKWLQVFQSQQECSMFFCGLMTSGLNFIWRYYTVFQLPAACKLKIKEWSPHLVFNTALLPPSISCHKGHHQTAKGTSTTQFNLKSITSNQKVTDSLNCSRKQIPSAQVVTFLVMCEETISLQFT